MDHDHEINAISSNEDSKVHLFLRESLKAIRHIDQKPYNLDAEFAKTRKNKDYFVVLVLFVAVFIIVLGAWIITSRINESSRNVPVDIAVFEDLNLKNVLDLAKKAEDTLVKTVDERNSLQINYQSELLNVRSQKKSELEIISSMKLSDMERARRNTAIETQYVGKEQAVKASYQQRFAVVDRALAEARKQVESFDTKRVEEARAQQMMLNNQRDLYELEKSEMKKSFEGELSALRTRMTVIQEENAKLKTTQIKDLIDEYQGHLATLDPVLEDPDAGGYMSAVAPYAKPAVPFSAIPKNIPSDFTFGSVDFSTVRKGYRGIDYLLTALSGIPYENGVHDYVLAAHKIALLVGDANERMLISSFLRLEQDEKNLALAQEKIAGMEKTLAENDTAIVEKQNVLSTYEKALGEFALANKYAGFILDVSNPASLRVLIVPDQKEDLFLAGNPDVYVYRDTRTFIATLTLSQNDDAIEATLVKLEKNKEIRAMDYIVRKKK